MKNLKSNLALLLLTFFTLFTLIGCNNEDSILLSDNNTSSDQEILQKIVDEDESLESFDLNYNEEDAMSFVLGKTAEEIFPVKIGQRMKLVEKNLDITIEGDTAYGTLTKTFEGVLFIVASLDSINRNIDSLDLNVYEKPFNTTVSRNLIFVKRDSVAESDSIRHNWKIESVSLPVGGTFTENILIESLTVFLPDGETITIEEPLEYYLSRGPSYRKLVPSISKYESVGLEVTIRSAYEQQDFVTLTHGAHRGRKHLRAKKRFEFVEGSETFDGVYYYRTYRGEWVVNQYKGHKHAVINAFPWGVIKDSEAPVETNSWGIPYYVN